MSGSVPARLSVVHGYGAAIGAVVGAIWFAVIGGWGRVDPTNLDWIAGDHAQHLIGWLFFRNEPFGLPLGRIDGLLHPVGTTLGFTDSNPWLSLLLRPIEAWLPVDFQFIGIWLLSCFILQGVFGFRIMEVLTAGTAPRLLGTSVFVTAPALADRVGHDTLSAHWLLLALVWLHLRSGAPVRNTLTWAWALNLGAAGVHPYLALMVLVLTLALLVRLCIGPEQLAPRAVIVWGTGLIVQTFAVFAVLGYFAGGESFAEGGFGTFSADLLAFINPMGHSLWLPTLPARDGQYEGYAYVGGGVIFLVLTVAIVLGLKPARRPSLAPRYRPLLVAGVMLWIFALSNHVSIAGYTVLTMRGLYEPLAPIVDAFRSSGRFIWPLYYLVITAALAVTVSRRTFGPRASTVMLALALAVQVVEARQNVHFGSGNPWARPQSPAWDGLDGTYRHLAFVPAFYPVGPAECVSDDATREYDDLIRASYLAYVKGLTFNSGYVARPPMAALRAYCRQLDADVAAGRFAYDTVYIVARGAMGPFLQPDSGATCGVLDGFRVCVSDALRGRFHGLLQSESEAR